MLKSKNTIDVKEYQNNLDCGVTQLLFFCADFFCKFFWFDGSLINLIYAHMLHGLKECSSGVSQTVHMNNLKFNGYLVIANIAVCHK